MKLSRGAAIAASLGFTFTMNTGQASFVLTLDDLSTGVIDVIVSDDQSAGFATSAGATTVADIYAGLGAMTYAGAAGNFNVNVTTGTSKPILAPGVMDLSSVNVTSSTGGTLVISLTDTDFTGTYPGYMGNYGGTTSTNGLAPPAGTGYVDFDFLYDSTNTEFGGASVFDPAPVGGPNFSGNGSNTVVAGNPDYSLSIFSTISHSGAQNTSFDAELRPVPIPASVWLFGSGLLGLVGIARRRS